MDGYNGEDTIILDDLDDNSKECGNMLKLRMDRYPCPAEVKGGIVQLRHSRFIVTSNKSPRELFCYDSVLVEAIERRCKITHMIKLWYMLCIWKK